MRPQGPTRARRRIIRTSEWLNVLTVGLFLLVWAKPASANGRFPAAQQLVVHPRDPNRLWLRATHGLLTSADRGASWHWICEQSIGYTGFEDPAIAITATGRVLAGVFDGLSQTDDDGCSFAFQPAIGEQNIADVSVEKADPTRALALSSTGDGRGGFVNQVWRTADSGASWVKLADDIDRTFLGLTIDAAPSDTKTIYLTGSIFLLNDGGSDLPTKGVLYRTNDDGKTWTATEVPGTDSRTQPYLSAVDPSDSQKLYIRVRGPDVYNQPDAFVTNWLLYSEDAGATFREILRANADFLGFALAPDGQTVFIGMGDSRQPGFVRRGDDAAFGLYRAVAPAFAFERVAHTGGVPAGHIGCLTFDGNDLWVCTSEFKQGFELARSSDRGATLEPVMQLADLNGPVQCSCETSTGQYCPAAWPAVCSLIGRCAPNAPGSAACGEPGDGSPPVVDSGSDGSGDSGPGGTGNATGTTSSACGCRLFPLPTARSTVLAMLLYVGSLGAFVARGRHRRKSSRPHCSPRT